MKRIILITGGQRSGKSQYAERLALSLSPNPVYVATAHIWDDEFRQRVEKHQERRGPEWTNIEEEKFLSRHDLTGRVAVIDCITLWCTNFFTPVDSQLSTVNCQLSRPDSLVLTTSTMPWLLHVSALSSMSPPPTSAQPWRNTLHRTTVAS